jgi:hypothetical protein
LLFLPLCAFVCQANFSSAPALFVTSPNGGETWEVDCFGARPEIPGCVPKFQVVSRFLFYSFYSPDDVSDIYPDVSKVVDDVHHIVDDVTDIVDDTFNIADDIFNIVDDTFNIVDDTFNTEKAGTGKKNIILAAKLHEGTRRKNKFLTMTQLEVLGGPGTLLQKGSWPPEALLDGSFGVYPLTRRAKPPTITIQAIEPWR